LIDLFDAHAVFAGDRTAHLDTEFENGGAELFGTLDLARRVGIEQNEGVQVAVARMEDVGATQAVLFFHVGDGAQHAGQVAARYRAVHAVVVGRDPAGGRKRVLAPRPEAQALFFGGGHLQAGRTRLGKDLIHAPDLVFDLFERAVGLTQQNRFGIEVVAGLYEGLHHVRGAFVHHFQAGRHDAGGDDVGHGVARRLDGGEAGHDDPRAGRRRNELDGGLRNNAQHAFGTDKGRQQIEAWGIGRFGAEFDHLAV